MRTVSKALASLGFSAVMQIPSTHAHSHSRFHHDHDHINGDDIRSLDGVSARQCGTLYPTPEQHIAARTVQYNGGMPDRWTINVPTYFHVIKDRAEGNDQDDVNASMSVLNNAFKLDTETFRFQVIFDLLETTYTTDASWFNTRQNGERGMKEALRSGYGFYGFAYYPDDCASLKWRDGVVINYRTVPNGSSVMNQGYTLVHEVGHWLGLSHTFRDGCDGQGDFIDDTPAHTVNEGCTVTDTCPGEGRDPISNYMSYSSDACMSEFTHGQYERIFAQWHMYRRVRLTLLTGPGFRISPNTLRKTPNSLCLPYNKKRACKNAGCYWKKSKDKPSTCVTEKPCLEYQEKKSCRKHDCHWKKKSLKCLASKPCSLYTRKRACNNAGCMFDKSLSPKCSSPSSSNT